MIEFKSGDRVKICGACTGTTEPYLGKTGEVVRKGMGYMDSQYLVRFENSDSSKIEIFFYESELKKV